MLCIVIGTGQKGTCTLADTASRALPRTTAVAAAIRPPRGATVSRSEEGRCESVIP